MYSGYSAANGGEVVVTFSVPVTDLNGDLTVDAYLGMFNSQDGIDDVFSSSNYFINDMRALLDLNLSFNIEERDIEIVDNEPYQTRYVFNPDRPAGEQVTTQEGREGSNLKVYTEFIYTETGEVIGRAFKSESELVAPVDEIIEVGLGTTSTPTEPAEPLVPVVETTVVRVEGQNPGNNVTITFTHPTTGEILDTDTFFIPDGQQGE